jgi:hypothetical protein
MFALSRNAQHLSLLFDDRPHGQSCLDRFAYVASAATVSKGLDDAHLIRYQAEDACELGAISRYALQAKIAGKWVQFCELRPGLRSSM